MFSVLYIKDVNRFQQIYMAKLFLLPCSLGGDNLDYVLPSEIRKILNNCNFYIVENIRSARRFLIKAGIDTKIDDLTFFELNKHTDKSNISQYLNPIKNGQNIGLLSEAGLPGIADPGSEIVSIAHRKNITVKPIVGPSSILLALISSGLNGQNFAFNGYLPKDKNQRIKSISKFESISFKNQQTQIFIETPFRNNHLLQDLIKTCGSNTEIAVATDLTMDSEKILRKKVKEWKSFNVDLHKKPTVFLIHKY